MAVCNCWESNSGEPIYETCDFDDVNIAIWCVYGHLHIGGLECISDPDTLEEAEGFMMEELPSSPIVSLISF